MIECRVLHYICTLYFTVLYITFYYFRNQCFKLIKFYIYKMFIRLDFCLNLNLYETILTLNYEAK